jgi:trehalose-phosphatase
MTGLPDLVYAGNHGLEISGPGLNFVHPDAKAFGATRILILQDLQDKLSRLPGVLIEDKGLTISVHYRQAPDEMAGEVESRFNTAVTPYLKPGGWKTTGGKKVFEVRPDIPWDKGKAIAYLQDAYPAASLTVFFGDDITDEDGFEVVQSTGGIAIFVGQARQPTKALHRLDSPQEVVETLQLIGQI